MKRRRSDRNSIEVTIIDAFLIVECFSTELMLWVNCAFRQAMISSAQCRAARGLLDWSQQEVAERAGIGVVTVRQLEANVPQPRRATLAAVRRCFEAAGSRECHWKTTSIVSDPWAGITGALVLTNRPALIS